MNLPLPRTKLVGCMWLARIHAKASLMVDDALPEDYAVFFCHPKGVDGQFLEFFSLDREQLMAMGVLSVEEAGRWFLELPQVDSKRIAEWNRVAENFGRQGYPMEAQFPKALSGPYRKVAHLKLRTVFEVIEADEKMMREGGGVSN